MADQNTSTLNAAATSIQGHVQSALGSLTGSQADKAKAEDKKAEAAATHDLSQATVKGPGFAATADGVAQDDPNRSQGSWNQTVGSGKEMVGNLIGSESMKAEGIEQNRQGKAQEAQGQLQDLGAGVKDRVGGAVGGAIAGITGDRQAQVAAQEQHDAGKARQRGVEADLQKQADAQAK